MSDWLSPQEREEFRAYNEKRYKEQHGTCLEQIAQLRGNLSLAEEGLANYQQELENAKHDIECLQEAAIAEATENERLRKALSERLQQLEEIKRTREQERDYAEVCYENERLRTELERTKALPVGAFRSL